MRIVIGTLIFCLVLFVYLHIFYHLKTSNDLEVYEIEQPSKDKLEEICDLRQPVMFDFNSERLSKSCCLQKVGTEYGAFDIKMRNVKEEDEEMGLFIPLTLKAAQQTFKNDSERKYLSERNEDFLEETGLIKCYRYNDAFLRPYMVSSCKYDFMSASENVETPFRYELNYRNFYLVTQGSAIIKLAPPKSSKYLYPIKDYDNFEFRSPINPWDVQSQYQPDFDKIKCLEISLKPGNIIYIPAFWWYSIKFSENTSICTFQYKTYMNMVAIAPQLVMKLLQGQNVKHQVAKKIDTNSVKTSEDNKKSEDIENMKA